jgi:thioredoxin 1
MTNNFNIEGFENLEIAIVDFSATWCGPCKALNPILDEISSTTDIKVFKIDVDENQQLAIEHGIRSIPTMLLFKKGQLVNRLAGMKRKEEILEAFN